MHAWFRSYNNSKTSQGLLSSPYLHCTCTIWHPVGYHEHSICSMVYISCLPCLQWLSDRWLSHWCALWIVLV